MRIHFVNLLERTFHSTRTDLELFAPFCNLGTGMIRSRKKLLVKDPREAWAFSIHHLLNALHLAGQLHGIPSVDCQDKLGGHAYVDDTNSLSSSNEGL
jgi:hypothetical protein